MSFHKLDWRKGAKYVKLVVGYSLLVEVSVHGGILTMVGSWWGEKVITSNILRIKRQLKITKQTEKLNKQTNGQNVFPYPQTWITHCPQCVV
jgi:hypothetical protein